MATTVETQEENIVLTPSQEKSLELIGNLYRKSIYSGNDLIEVLDIFISSLLEQNDEMCQTIVSEFIRYKKVVLNLKFIRKLRSQIDILRRIFLRTLPKGVSITTEFRIKGFESTVRKVVLYYLEDKSIDLSDLVAFRSIVDSLASEEVNTSYCYDIKNICMEYFKKDFRCTVSTPAKQVGSDPCIKNYIEAPRDGYQSIHIAYKTVISNDTFEVQIRTLQMHEDAEVGKAAHSGYKGKKYEAVNKHIFFDPKKVKIPGFKVFCNGEIYDTIGLKKAKHIA